MLFIMLVNEDCTWYIYAYLPGYKQFVTIKYIEVYKNKWPIQLCLFNDCSRWYNLCDWLLYATRHFTFSASVEKKIVKSVQTRFKAPS